MLLITSLLASSLDGFISGFILKSAGTEFKKQDYAKIFLTITICCLLASKIGSLFNSDNISSYINAFGSIIMLYLAISSFYSGNTDDNRNSTNPFTIAISLAADASIVCMYLCMSGYSIYEVSVISGSLHTALMIVGSMFSKSILGDKFSKFANILAGIIFLLMSIMKFKSI